MVSKGDILYALYGATSGEVGISKLNGAINQAILAIKPISEINSIFLVQELVNEKDSILGTYLQGGQGNLSGEIVKGLTLLFPSLEEQQLIAQLFDQLDKTVTLHQCKSQ